MPIVRVPDGRMVRFPDDMPREQIKGIIAEKFPEETAQSGNTGGYDKSYVAQGLSGINEGIANVAGFPVDAANSVIGLGMKGVNAAFGTNFQPVQAPIFGSESVKGMMGPAIKPETNDPGKQFVRRIGQEVGAAAIPGGALAAKAARPVAMAAAQFTGAVGSGVGAGVARNLAPDNPYAELAGQILGGGLAVGASKLAKRAITPFPSSAAKSKAVAAMKQEGVDLTAGQATGNEKLKYLESELGGGSASSFTEKQSEQFTQAVMSKIGVRANRATTEVMNHAYKKIGQQFDDLASSNTLVPDAQFGKDLAKVAQDYSDITGVSSQAPIISKRIGDIVSEVQKNGRISGDFYKSFTSEIAKKARSAKANPELANALYGVRSAMDDAMERSIAKTNPGDLGLWKAARSDYRNYLIIEKAASRAGEATASGLISPANLRSSVASVAKRSYVTGKDSLGNLARAGVETMTPLPQSGTAPRQAVRNIVSAAPTALGMYAGNTVGGGPGAFMGAIAGATLPPAMGQAILSKVGRRYLSNQLLNRNIPIGQSLGGALSGGLANTENNARNRVTPLKITATP